MSEKLHRRKVIQFNNSSVLGIPAEIRKRLNIQKGESFDVEYDEVNEVITYKRVKPPAKLPEGVRPGVVSAMDRVMGRYDNALRNLKNR
ncbi:AbrB/MazE/SpoVT family DNA-binding domain-containing protein [Alkalicoccus luteus]|uniref:AbrB/MazE/SpoVT family DNA-binding domain-containing protein n=1 Tax=Alkalicoccus luteus TaxID=1237094 RepID=A0A969PRZ6_9BACI|nr:AbrB/MazE/SpoVT family DNA-binding domain-containing protein [Alkalicoccus luteus]NJP39312.1 AbrB/MazE/SpoVT family DNA-binding domain-containing protein [Alkalicoccus luteus]